MSIELHNFEFEDERLVQVETQPHHIAGVLAEVNEILADNPEIDFSEIYSAYFECEEDGTITFYEAESAEAGNPGIWTYMVYDCEAGKEEVVTNTDINSLAPVIQLQNLVLKS